MPKTLTRDELNSVVRGWYEPDVAEDSLLRIDGFLRSGSIGIAVYQNEDLSHPQVGDKVIVPFGPENTVKDPPPDQCPIELPYGKQSWRYVLYGVYQPIPAWSATP